MNRPEHYRPTSHEILWAAQWPASFIRARLHDYALRIAACQKDAAFAHQLAEASPSAEGKQGHLMTARHFEVHAEHLERLAEKDRLAWQAAQMTKPARRLRPVP